MQVSVPTHNFAGTVEEVTLPAGGTFVIVDDHGNALFRVIASGGDQTATQASPIPDPAGGATADAESRTAIAAILDMLRAVGLVQR